MKKEFAGILLTVLMQLEVHPYPIKCRQDSFIFYNGILLNEPYM